MAIELITVGSELLFGDVPPASRWAIARELYARGICCARMTIIPEEATAIQEAIQDAMAHSSVIVITGGSGFRQRTLAHHVVSEVVKRPLVFSPLIYGELIRRWGRVNEERIKEQSYIVQGAILVPNPVEGVPGQVVEAIGKTIYLLPGVPEQLEAMVPLVLPHLQRRLSSPQTTARLYFALLAQERLSSYLSSVKEKTPEIAVSITRHGGVISLYLSGPIAEEVEAVKEHIASHFAPYVYSSHHLDIVPVLQQAMVAQGKTLAVAESCTGGAVSAKIAAYPGASRYFLGGMVPYSLSLKHLFLGVSQETSIRRGAVSREVALEMANGVRAKTGASVGLALSGMLAPTGGAREAPVGTVWSAIATPQKAISYLIPASYCFVEREHAVANIVDYTLAALWRFLVHGEAPPP